MFIDDGHNLRHILFEQSDVAAALRQTINHGLEIIPAALQLFGVVDAALQNVENSPDIIEGEAEAFAAQDTLKPRNVPSVEQTRLTVAFRRQETLVFIEADSPGRDAKMFGKIANADPAVIGRDM